MKLPRPHLASTAPAALTFAILAASAVPAAAQVGPPPPGMGPSRDGPPPPAPTARGGPRPPGSRAMAGCPGGPDRGPRPGSPNGRRGPAVNRGPQGLGPPTTAGRRRPRAQVCDGQERRPSTALPFVTTRHKAEGNPAKRLSLRGRSGSRSI